jgi:hypothetical protein
MGVRRVFSDVRGRFYYFYEATWSPMPNRQKKKRFSVNHYGESEPRALAISPAAWTEGDAGLTETCAS